jgi:hypothetical protein
MFGHDDMNPQQGNQGGMPLPQPDATLTHGSSATVTPPSHQAPALPTGDDDQAGSSAPAVDDSANDTAGDYIMDDAPAAATPDPAPAASVSSVAAVDTSDVSTDELLDIKQGALQQLTPLLGHLDQSPEERFRTTMMLIQASDNQALLKAAYDAAQQIEDEKTRAQALLDVVNEINYFTQQSGEGQAEAGQEAV